MNEVANEPLTYALYVDKSGNANPVTCKNPVCHVVLGGCVIKPPMLPIAATTIKNALEKWDIQFEPDREFKWEHVSQAFGRGVQKVPIFDKTKVRNLQTLGQCFGELLDACSKIDQIYFLASVTEKRAAYQKHYIKCAQDVLYYTYMHLVERFVYLLRGIKKTVKRPVHGIIYADQDDNTYRKALESLHIGTVLKGQSFYTSFPEIVEMVAFLPSHVSIGLKIADYVAGAVYRYYEHNDDKWLQRLICRFYSNKFPNGPAKLEDAVGYGIKVFP